MTRNTPIDLNSSVRPRDDEVEGHLVEEQYPDLLAEECKVPKPDKVLKYGTAGEPYRYSTRHVFVGRFV